MKPKNVKKILTVMICCPCKDRKNDNVSKIK